MYDDQSIKDLVKQEINSYIGLPTQSSLSKERRPSQLGDRLMQLEAR